MIKCERIYECKNDTIAIKLEARGFSYRVILISQNTKLKFIPDSTKEYVYNGVSTIYYKLNKDTLLIYSPIKVKEPIYFESKIKIKQIVFKNPEMMNLRKTYLEQGLKKME